MGERARLFFDRPWKDLTREFNLRTRLSEVYLPASLYNTYLKAYRRADALQRQTLVVLNDGEHLLAMEEGRDFFKLPNTDFLRKDLDNLRITLDSFNPYLAPVSKDGRIRLTDSQMEGFFKMFSQTFDIVHESFESFRHTDYFKLFRYLRDDRKVPYAGPTSLHELVVAYFGVARVYIEQSKYYHDIIDQRHEKLELKVQSAMQHGGPVIEFSSQGVKIVQPVLLPQ